MKDAPVMLHLGDSREVLQGLPSGSVDLVVTSPPYADQRQSTYGGINPENYVDWFLPIGAELQRVLKPTGTFILNIKERVVSGERHPYVLELIRLAQAEVLKHYGVSLELEQELIGFEGAEDP